MIIKLHEVTTGNPVLINLTQVAFIQQDGEEDDTREVIFTADAVGNVAVSETLDEINDIIRAASAPA